MILRWGLTTKFRFGCLGFCIRFGVVSCPSSLLGHIGLYAFPSKDDENKRKYLMES